MIAALLLSLVAASHAAPAAAPPAKPKKLPAIKRCIQVLPGDKWREPLTLASLRGCQDTARQEWSDKIVALTGDLPSDEEFDKVDARHAEEIQTFLERHPDQAEEEKKRRAQQLFQDAASGKTGGAPEAGISKNANMPMNDPAKPAIGAEISPDIPSKEPAEPEEPQPTGPRFFLPAGSRSAGGGGGVLEVPQTQQMGGRSKTLASPRIGQ